MPDAITSRFRAARQDRALVVLEGLHAVKHAIRFAAEIDVIATPDPDGVLALALQLAPDVVAPMHERLEFVPAAVYRELSPTPHDSGVMAIARRTPPPIDLAQLDPISPIVLLESPSHSGNIGAVIRVAAAAGAAAVISTGPLDPWNPAAVRGSAGLHFALPVVHMPWRPFVGRALVAIDPDGAELDRTFGTDRTVLAFGSERRGLSQELRDEAAHRIRIPMQPQVSSLNLATAVAVMLYHWRLQ